MYLALPCTSWYEINEMTLFIQPNGKERFYQAARIGVLPSATSQILSFLTPLSATSVLCLAAVWKICACAQSCPSLCDPVGYSLLSSSIHAIFSGKDHGVDCHFLLQGIFLIQESNLYLLCLLHWQADSLPLCHLKTTACESQPFLSCWSKKGIETFWLLCTFF